MAKIVYMIGTSKDTAVPSEKSVQIRRFLCVVLPVVDICLILSIVLRDRLSALLLGQTPVCPARAIGLVCGSCGATRCFFELLYGNFSAAFARNPLFFLVAGYAVVILIAAHVFVLCGNRVAEQLLRALVNWKAAVIFAVLWAVFTVVRNLV